MSTKSKGISAEREIIHMFWKTDNWAAIRLAGSGSIKYPCVDIIAGKQGRKLAIESKNVSTGNLFFSKQDLEQLVDFANRFGAEPWVAIKFDKKGWYFFPVNVVMELGSGKSFNIENASTYGISFEEIIKN